MATEIIIGGRATGKTTELIKRSAETGRYILVANKNQANYIFNTAQKMGYHVPFPLTFGSGSYNSHGFTDYRLLREGVYIDDLDDIVRAVIGSRLNYAPVKAVTISRNPLYKYFITDLDKTLDI